MAASSASGNDVSTFESQSNNGRKRKLEDDPSIFRYGNYSRYYGRRLCQPKNNNEVSSNLALCQKLPVPFFDPRLAAILAADVVGDKRLLDVGCNDGSLTLALTALTKHPARKILAIDIDQSLIVKAKAKLRQWMDLADGIMRTKLCRVKFECENYVLPRDECLQYVKPQYDTILMLSITKWIHLNWADNGLKRFFARAAKNLNLGGKLLVEPQDWRSYEKARKAKKRCWNDELEANYRSIQFKPDQFVDYLLSLGFEQCDSLKPSCEEVKNGFDRDILVFRKVESE